MVYLSLSGVLLTLRDGKALKARGRFIKLSTSIEGLGYVVSHRTYTIVTRLRLIMHIHAFLISICPICHTSHSLQ